MIHRLYDDVYVNTNDVTYIYRLEYKLHIGIRNQPALVVSFTDDKTAQEAAAKLAEEVNREKTP